MATSLSKFSFFNFDVGKWTGNKANAVPLKGTCWNPQMPSQITLCKIRGFFFFFPPICGIMNTSCNVYNCQPARPRLWQTRRWCVCSGCLAHATGWGPWHVQKAFWPNCEPSSALTKVSNVSIPTLWFHNSLLQDTLTCFQDLAFLHSPTTWLSALQPLLMLLRHASQKHALTQLLNILWYPMEAGAHGGEKLLWETAFQLWNTNTS